MKLKIFIFSGFIILVETILTQIEIDNQLLDDHHIDLEFEWEIISEFMKDQHGVTLFVENGYEDFGDKILKYSLKNYQFAVYRYSNITLLSQFCLSFRNNYAVFTNRIYGGILVMNDQRLMDLVINTCDNIKLVLVLFDVNVEYIKKFMLDIWNREKAFEVITMSIRVTGQNTIVQLNPFELKFFEYPIISVNSSKTIVELIYYRFRLFLTNMAGYEIKIFMSEIPIYSVLVRNSSGNVIEYSGVDGTFLKLCKKFMNFTPIFVDILTDPKIMSGLDKVIDNGLAELGINSRFIPDVSYNNTVFLYPTDKLAMGFVVPINYEEIPLKILTYESFDVKSRVIIALGLIFLSAVWMLGRRLIKKNIETASAAIPFKVIALLHNTPVPHPKSAFNQIVFITITFFSLLLTSIYQGTIVQQLNNPLKLHQITTLKELYNSNLNLTTFMYVQRSKDKTIQDNKDKLIMTEEIGTKTVTQYESIQEGLDMVAYNKTTAFLIPITFYAPFSGKYFNITTGLDLLHIITEPSSSMPVSYVIARNSPYIHILNHVVKLSVENGILKHETVVATTHEQYLYYIRRIKNGYVPKEKNHFRPIKLADLNYLQIFILINWTLSGIVFLLEHLVCLVVKYKQTIKGSGGESIPE